ncbi:MAG: hypothetical protein AAF806_03810 [Bacteroidota bacterium]
MIIEELKKKINKHQFDDVLEVLDEVFKDDNPLYNKLNERYIERPIGYADTTFKSKLLRFVKRYKRDIEKYIQGIREDKTFQQDNSLKSYDYLYKLLCDLDFKHQVEYFNTVVKTPRAVIPFVIRAERNFGQKWLYNRLINHYANQKKPIHRPLVFNFEELKLDTFGFLEELSKGLEIKISRIQEEYEVNFARIINGLCKNAQTATQFIIIENAYSFLHASSLFDSFYHKLLKELEKYMRAMEAKHKCIFLFIEHSSKPYQITDYILFTEKVKKSEARRSNSLKFIDLKPNSSISKEDFRTWIDNSDQHIFDCFDYYFQQRTIDEILSKECGDGNPEEVLKFICSEMKIDYEEHQNLWLKH